MVCAEKGRLRNEYSTAGKDLSAALKKLGTETGEELVKAVAASQAARAECAEARRALAEHKAQHGC
jgi:hypothetical protein